MLFGWFSGDVGTIAVEAADSKLGRHFLWVDDANDLVLLVGTQSLKLLALFHLKLQKESDAPELVLLEHVCDEWRLHLLQDFATLD